jgi:hypothetical protein
VSQARMDHNHNPYVGPRIFTRDEADRFFGRESEAQALVSLVASERLALFYAQSGAGKSSLINTRLVRGLQEIGFVVLPIGRVGGELPAGVGRVDNIYAFNLMLSLEKGDGNPNRLAHINLSHFLARLTSPDGEAYTYDEAAGLDKRAQGYEEVPYVLIIDQFEELITSHLERWPERAGFFRQLNQAMADDPLLRVVLVIREDHVAALDPYAPLLAGKLQARFYMQRMGYAAALEAIQEPARLGGRPFTPEAARTLVDNLRQIRGQGSPSVPSTRGEGLPTSQSEPAEGQGGRGRSPWANSSNLSSCRWSATNCGKTWRANRVRP